MGLLPAVTDRPLVPAGISHDVDLSGMTQGQRQRHHTRQLGRIAFYDGKNGVDAYKQRHPEAGQHRVNLNALAYVQKPPGYSDAIANMVGHWFDSDTALAATNGSDVDRLNARLGTDRFDRRNHFSKPLPPAVRKQLASIFQRRGAALPSSAKTMSAVRQAVRSFKAGSRPSAEAFGKVGTRAGDTLSIGSRAFTVSRNGNRECIWITGDKRRRVYLDDILAIADLLDGEDGCSPYPVYNTVRDRHYLPETADPAPVTEDVSRRSSLAAVRADPAPADRHYDDEQTPLPPTRADLERLAAERLAAAHVEAAAAGCDILEL